MTDEAGNVSESLPALLERARATAAELEVDTTGARIPHLRIHDLRRTLGSWQAKTGASLAIIGKSLNHKRVQTTAIYARLDLDPVRDSVTRATTAMFAAAGIKPPRRLSDLKNRSENSAGRGQFLTLIDVQAPGNSRTIAQESGEKWTVQADLQPISLQVRQAPRPSKRR